MELFTKQRRLERSKFYHTKTWRLIRKKQLNKHPLCEHCLKVKKVEKAVICDHITPDWASWLEFKKGPFQSLCRLCHQHKTSFDDLPLLIKKEKTKIIITNT